MRNRVAVQKIQPGMDGKNPLLILDDADLDTAVGWLAQRRFLNRAALHWRIECGRYRAHL